MVQPTATTSEGGGFAVPMEFPRPVAGCLHEVWDVIGEQHTADEHGTYEHTELLRCPDCGSTRIGKVTGAHAHVPDPAPTSEEIQTSLDKDLKDLGVTPHMREIGVPKEIYWPLVESGHIQVPEGHHATKRAAQDAADRL